MIIGDGLRQIFAEKEELGAVVNNRGSLVHVDFGSEGEVRTYSDLNLDGPAMVAFHLAALGEGVYFAPRCLMDTSTAMDERVVDDALEACSRAAARVVDLLDFTRAGG